MAPASGNQPREGHASVDEQKKLRSSGGRPAEWQIAVLPEIIDPQNIIAFRIGEHQYALHDK
ncbi:MAG: hypothetical protein IJJ99_10410 [Oscillospiraceae bacterium]|nr:hypothetical protein [Oscillospiraceae bacterium]